MRLNRRKLTSILLVDAPTPKARRRALLAGAAVDILDVVACTWGYMSGELGAAPAMTFGGGAVSFAILVILRWQGRCAGKESEGSAG